MIPRLASLTHGWGGVGLGWVGGIAKRVWRLGLILDLESKTSIVRELHNLSDQSDIHKRVSFVRKKSKGVEWWWWWW